MFCERGCDTEQHFDSRPHSLPTPFPAFSAPALLLQTSGAAFSCGSTGDPFHRTANVIDVCAFRERWQQGQHHLQYVCGASIGTGLQPLKVKCDRRRVLLDKIADDALVVILPEFQIILLIRIRDVLNRDTFGGV